MNRELQVEIMGKKSSFDVEAAYWMLSNEFSKAIEFLVVPVIVVFFMREKKKGQEHEALIPCNFLEEKYEYIDIQQKLVTNSITNLTIK